MTKFLFGVESIIRASLDIRDATTSTPGTLNDLTTDLIMANNNNNMEAIENHCNTETGKRLRETEELQTYIPPMSHV